VYCPECRAQIAADDSAAWETLQAVKRNHTRYCTGGGAMNQCSRCMDVATIVDGGTHRLEEAASVLGVPAPGLHKHLAGHGREDLLRRLSFAGEPILPPKLEETTVVVESEPEPEEPADEWPENVDPQELVDAGLVEVHVTEESYDRIRLELGASIETLASDHPDSAVRHAAAALSQALIDYEQNAMARAELQRLVDQRNELNELIEQLAARLGDAEPKPVRNLTNQELGIAGESPAAVRAWCRDNGVDVSATGRIGRASLEAYRAAHGGAA
jgi:hypothetical protein